MHTVLAVVMLCLLSARVVMFRSTLEFVVFNVLRDVRAVWPVLLGSGVFGWSFAIEILRSWIVSCG